MIKPAQNRQIHLVYILSKGSDHEYFKLPELIE